MLLATDRNNGLIQMPLVADPTGTAAANVVGKRYDQFPCPQADRLVRDNDPPSAYDIRNVSEGSTP
jgi:hypothetical protein